MGFNPVELVCCMGQIWDMQEQVAEWAAFPGGADIAGKNVGGLETVR